MGVCQSTRQRPGRSSGKSSSEEHPESQWITFKKYTFDVTDCVVCGRMSEHDAQQKILDNPDEFMGYCFHGKQSRYYWIVGRGTLKVPGMDGWFTTIYKPGLQRSKSSRNLFCDDFSQTPAALGELSKVCLPQWARPGRGEDLLDNLSHLEVISSIDPNDLDQGGLEDCWLVCCLTALAEFPHLVKGMLQPCSLSADGRYTIALYNYKRQLKEAVTVDDCLPALRNGRPAFTNASESGEIWPCLVEKALAKHLGGYERLYEGDPLVGLGLLTGCDDLVMMLRTTEKSGGVKWVLMRPVFDPENPFDLHARGFEHAAWPDNSGGEEGKTNKEVLQLLASYDRQNYLMLCSPGETDGKDLKSHAFAILAVALKVAGQEFDLLKVRNPWEGGEWRGHWSVRSPTWSAHPLVRDALRFAPVDDGSFWIEAEDFFKQYGLLYVCRMDMGKNRHKHLLDKQEFHGRLGGMRGSFGLTRSVGSALSELQDVHHHHGQGQSRQPISWRRHKRRKLKSLQVDASEGWWSRLSASSAALTESGTPVTPSRPKTPKTTASMSTIDAKIARQLAKTAQATPEQLEFFDAWLLLVFGPAFPRAQQGARYLQLSTDLRHLEMRISGEAGFMMELAKDFVETCNVPDKSMFQALQTAREELQPSKLSLWCRLKRMGTDNPAVDAGFIVHQSMNWLMADLLMPTVEEQDALREHSLQEAHDPIAWAGSMLPAEPERSLMFQIAGTPKRLTLSSILFFKCLGFIKPNESVLRALTSSNASLCTVGVSMGPKGLTRLSLGLHQPDACTAQELAQHVHFDYRNREVDQVLDAFRNEKISVVEFIVDAGGYSVAAGFTG